MFVDLACLLICPLCLLLMDLLCLGDDGVVEGLFVYIHDVERREVVAVFESLMPLVCCRLCVFLRLDVIKR